MGQTRSRKTQFDLDCASHAVLLPIKLQYLDLEFTQLSRRFSDPNQFTDFHDVGVMVRGVTLRLACRVQR